MRAKFDFAGIMEEALREAADVDCPFAVFVEGLEEMQDILSERVNVAQDELRTREEK